MIHLCVTPERVDKTLRLMTALSRGMSLYTVPPEPHQIVKGSPLDDGEPFVLWGQAWLAMRVLPRAVEQGRPFWHIDNGYVNPARGGLTGFYRINYRSLSPMLLNDVDHNRIYETGAKARLHPWRKPHQRGRKVLIALPGADFGVSLGMDMRAWIAHIHEQVQSRTDRPIFIRPKESSRPLVQDLRDAWCVVTHSSNVAVDAVMYGVPVFVAPTSPAAPVGRTDLKIEKPVMPDRTDWLASLMMQQFTLDEMRFGYAWRMMQRMAEQCLLPSS
jgi:hypothetical protein